jgi:integrase
MATGITKRHSRKCRSRGDGRCDCNAGWEAWVFSKRDGKKIRRVFERESEAKGWRADALSALSKGALRAPKPTTVGQAWEAWEEGVKAGTIRNRSGDVYKPSALRSYERAMRLRVLPAVGSTRLIDVRHLDLQDFADRLLAEGLNPSTIKCTLLPLRAVFRRAMSRGELMVDPCSGLDLAAVRGGRDRIADPVEAAALIAAVPDQDRALWATAMYAGLRLGELRALRDESIDLAAGVIRVERGWDDKEGEIAVKSAAANRRVPIAALLRALLLEHRMKAGWDSSALAFGRTPSDAFNPKMLQQRADTAWADAGLERLTLHECRHTFASLMIAAGVNAKALSTYMGHATISITLDRYGHLMPGSEDEAAGLLDTYLTAADEKAHGAGGGLTGAQTGAPVARGS